MGGPNFSNISDDNHINTNTNTNTNTNINIAINQYKIWSQSQIRPIVVMILKK